MMSVDNADGRCAQRYRRYVYHQALLQRSGAPTTQMAITLRDTWETSDTGSKPFASANVLPLPGQRPNWREPAADPYEQTDG